MRSIDPLQGAFESDLAAWLAWLAAVRGAQADERAMRRLEVVWSIGWAAVCAAGIAVPLLGVAAVVLCLAFLFGMLWLGYVVTDPRYERPSITDAAADGRSEMSSLGNTEQAHLMRIINLSRVASSPLGASLLSSELDEAVVAEPLANWAPLRELRDILRTEGSRLVPFGSEYYRDEIVFLVGGE